MNSRQAVLANIRRALGVAGNEAPRRFEVEGRLQKAPVGVVPQRGQGDLAARVAPSRSADIEQTLLLGAHGPRRLHIVIAG